MNYFRFRGNKRQKIVQLPGTENGQKTDEITNINREFCTIQTILYLLGQTHVQQTWHDMSSRTEPKSEIPGGPFFSFSQIYFLGCSIFQARHTSSRRGTTCPAKPNRNRKFRVSVAWTIFSLSQIYFLRCSIFQARHTTSRRGTICPAELNQNRKFRVSVA